MHECRSTLHGDIQKLIASRMNKAEIMLYIAWRHSEDHCITHEQSWDHAEFYKNEILYASKGDARYIDLSIARLISYTQVEMIAQDLFFFFLVYNSVRGSQRTRGGWVKLSQSIAAPACALHCIPAERKIVYSVISKTEAFNVELVANRSYEKIGENDVMNREFLEHLCNIREVRAKAWCDV